MQTQKKSIRRFSVALIHDAVLQLNAIVFECYKFKPRNNQNFNWTVILMFLFYQADRQ